MRPPSPPPEGKGQYRRPYPARKGGAGDRTESAGKDRDRQDREAERKRVRNT